jgi:hypothetical protein
LSRCHPLSRTGTELAVLEGVLGILVNTRDKYGPHVQI